MVDSLEAALSLTGVAMALRGLFTKGAPTVASGLGPFASAGGSGTRWQGLCHARGLKVAALPDLEYDYGALEPAISGEIMRLHHQKHHKAYVSNYNDALEKLDAAMAKGDVPAVVRLQSAIKFNGGGSNSVVVRFFLPSEFVVPVTIVGKKTIFVPVSVGVRAL